MSFVFPSSLKCSYLLQLNLQEFCQSIREVAFELKVVHRHLDSLAEQYCPVVKQLELSYNWSIMQAEYATDIVFKRQPALQAIYPHLLESLIQAVKPADIASFLGRKLHDNYFGLIFLVWFLAWAIILIIVVWVNRSKTDSKTKRKHSYNSHDPIDYAHDPYSWRRYRE